MCTFEFSSLLITALFWAMKQNFKFVKNEILVKVHVRALVLVDKARSKISSQPVISSKKWSPLSQNNFEQSKIFGSGESRVRYAHNYMYMRILVYLSYSTKLISKKNHIKKKKTLVQTYNNKHLLRGCFRIHTYF